MFNSLKRIKNFKSVIKMFHTENARNMIASPAVSRQVFTFNKTTYRRFSEQNKKNEENTENKNQEENKEENKEEQQKENKEENTDESVNFKTSRKIQRLIFLIMKIMFYAGSLVTFLNIWVYAKYTKPTESPLYNKYGYGIVRFIHTAFKSITDVKNILK